MTNITYGRGKNNRKHYYSYITVIKNSFNITVDLDSPENEKQIQKLILAV